MASLLLEFANGAQATIQASYVTHLADPGFRPQVCLFGEDGTLEARGDQSDFSSPGVVTGAKRNEERFGTLAVPDEFTADPDGTDFFRSFMTRSAGPRAFIEAIVADLPVSPSFNDGMKAQEVVDAALASHETGSWITLP